MLTLAFKQAVDRGIQIVCHVGEGSSRDRSRSHGDGRAASVLEGLGCSVVLVRGIRSGFAVFDKKASWYGDLPLLGFPASDACSIRIDNAEVAHDLLRDMLGRDIGMKV